MRKPVNKAYMPILIAGLSLLLPLTAAAGLVITPNPIPQAPPAGEAMRAFNPQNIARKQTSYARAQKQAQKRQARKDQLATQLTPEDTNTRTVLIFLDDIEITNQNVHPYTLFNTMVALINESGYILASGSQLSQVFNSSYSGQNSQVTMFLNLVRTFFNSEKWIVRKIDEQSNLFILLPKAEFSDEDWLALKASGNKTDAITTPLEIKLGIKIDHMLRIQEIEEDAEPQKAIQKYFDSRYEHYLTSASQEKLASDFIHAITSNTIFVPKYQHENLPYFALYLIGHGDYAHSIAGISIIAPSGQRSPFQQLPIYLEKKINTKIFVYNSCYAAGFNAKLIYGELMEEGSTQTYSFAIATAATGDLPVGQRVVPIPNSSHLSFNVSFKQFAQEVKKSIIDYKKALLSIIPQTHISSIAHLRPANSPVWFAITELDTAVIVVNRIKALAYEKNKKPLIIKPYKDANGITHDPKALLIGAQELNFPIIIDKNIKTLPIFISTLPGAVTHTFSSITYEGSPFDIGDFVGYGDIQYGAPKQFKILTVHTINPEDKHEIIKDVEIISNEKNLSYYGANSDGTSHSFSSKKIFSIVLIQACMTGDLDSVSYALANGADINVQDENGNTPLFIAIILGNKPLIEFLINHNADTHIAENNGVTPLHQAALSGNKEIVQLLIKKGIQIDVPALNGTTALHSAIVGGNIQIVKLFIEHGFNVNAVAKTGHTPIHFAAMFVKKEIVELLIQHEADVNAQTVTGGTPLMAAAATGNTAIAELLIKNGAQINVSGPEGNTALHAAAATGHKEIVELLIKHGAAVHLKNNKNETALDLAIQEKRDDIATILREHEAPESEWSTY